MGVKGVRGRVGVHKTWQGCGMYVCFYRSRARLGCTDFWNLSVWERRNERGTVCGVIFVYSKLVMKTNVTREWWHGCIALDRSLIVHMWAWVGVG